jgi:carboxymethylenebutenolidase
MERRDFMKATSLAAAAGAVSMASGCQAPGAGEGASSDGAPDQPAPGSLDAIFGEHMEAELAGDLDKTMATMTPDPHIVNIPTMIGGQGPAGVRQFYANRLIGQFFPEDVQFETISETASDKHLVTEMVISFTHTIEMDHILPGVEPTGKYAEVVFVVIVGFKDGKVEFEHIHWDQANLLVQLGLIDPAGLPLTGAGAAAKLRDASIPDPFYGES